MLTRVPVSLACGSVSGGVGGAVAQLRAIASPTGGGCPAAQLRVPAPGYLCRGRRRLDTTTTRRAVLPLTSGVRATGKLRHACGYFSRWRHTGWLQMRRTFPNIAKMSFAVLQLEPWAMTLCTVEALADPRLYASCHDCSNTPHGASLTRGFAMMVRG